MGNSLKIVLIGIDGATWNLIKPWASKGKLPTFNHLLRNGTHGTLKSTIPPLSPSAWASIYTGCHPSKHGVFSFVKRKEKSYFYRPISSNDIRKPTIWETLSQHGKRTIVVNAPFTYPPKPFNGVIVTGLGTPSKKAEFTHPRHYKNLILRKCPRYDVDFNEDLILASGDTSGLTEKIREVTAEQARLTLHLAQNEKWDLLITVFRTLDAAQHYFWHDKPLLLELHRLIDSFTGEILSLLENENHILIIASDHGFTPVRKYLCATNWLEQTGMLKYGNPPGNTWSQPRK